MDDVTLLPDTFETKAGSRRGTQARPCAAAPSPASRQADVVNAVICVPTFRRPEHLLKTLRSIEQQRAEVTFAVVVVENDAVKQEGFMAASQFFATSAIDGVCVVEQQQGNCAAINRVLEVALERYPSAAYLLMLDDDEYAAANWLGAMIAAARKTGADIVGGPVLPQIADPSLSELRQHPAFRPAYDRSGEVPVIYGSGNFLIQRDALRKMPRPLFDMRFNFLGGGDTDFFCRARDRGYRFYWESDAEVRETVPLDRTKFVWLLRRGFRIGAINYLIELKKATGGAKRGKLMLRNVAHVPLALVRAGSILRTERGVAALHPIAVACGRWLAAFGIEPQQYAIKRLPK